MSTYDIIILLQLLAALSGNPKMDMIQTQMSIENNPQVLYEMYLDMDYVNLYNKLSFDKIYGFQTTSDMTLEEEFALMGINGAFYDQYGRALGTLIKSSEVLSLPSDDLPELFQYNGQWVVDNLQIEAIWSTPQSNIPVTGINIPTRPYTIIMMTPEYGQNTKIEQPNIAYTVVEDRIQNIQCSNGPVDIPINGYIMVQTIDINDPLEEIYHLKIGDRVSVDYHTTPSEYQIKDIAEAVQGGGWLVQNGKNVAKSKESYIGNTNIKQPRTAIGTDINNNIIAFVADGRLPGYSVGLTGTQLADIMIQRGIHNGMYLDGGASSTLVYNRQVINKPSNGKERIVAHILVGKYKIPTYFLELFTEW